MHFTDTLLPLLALLIYIMLNLHAIKHRGLILIPIILGALIWFAGQFGPNNSWLIKPGFSLFILGIIADAVIRFYKIFRGNRQ